MTVVEDCFFCFNCNHRFLLKKQESGRVRKRTPHVLPTLISRAWVWNDLILAIEKTWPTAASSVKLFSATKRASQSNWIIFFDSKNSNLESKKRPCSDSLESGRASNPEPPTQPERTRTHPAPVCRGGKLCHSLFSMLTNQSTNQPTTPKPVELKMCL